METERQLPQSIVDALRPIVESSRRSMRELAESLQPAITLICRNFHLVVCYVQSPVIDGRSLSIDVVDLSKAIVADGAWDRMPILADALMDAGCENDELIAHLRGEPHECGWVKALVEMQG